MKKLIKKLLAATLFLGVVGNVQAEEWKTYKIKVTNERKNSEDVITLDEGDKAEFIHLIASTNYEVCLVIKTRFDEDFTVDQRYYAAESQGVPSIGNMRPLENFRTIYGPCKIFVGADSTGYGGNRSIFCNVKITRAHELKGNNLTGYSLVLPESTDTNYKLLLESSTDLVDWKADQTGSKAPSNRKRFYRLRAVKE
ncbi:hypothetical protein OAA59_00610 [bacterium]|nr:hypothetical protein [bacterium]